MIEQPRPPAPDPQVVDYLAEQIAGNAALTSRFAPLRADLPTAALAQTHPRAGVTISNLPGTLVSGRQSFCAIYLSAGMVISTITVCSGTTAAGTPTAQWFSLYDANRNKLAVTADDTTTAWGSNSYKTLTLSSPYTVPTSGIYYIGVMVAASTVPTMAGFLASTLVINLPPILCGADTTNTGLTTPATAPATAATLTGSSNYFYAYVA